MLYILILLSLSLSIAKNYDIAICAVAKNENLDILEWVAYHKKIGIHRIYLLDHHSEMPMNKSIMNYIRNDFVDYLYLPPEFHSSTAQIAAYNLCITKKSHYHDFMAFIDIDEFIVIAEKSKSLSDVIQPYSKFGGILLHWMLFGTSGHINRPKGGILRNYFQCAPSIDVKAIVNTKYILPTPAYSPSGYGIHYFVLKDGFYYVDTNFNPIIDYYSNSSIVKNAHTLPRSFYSKLYINHYRIKSLEDYRRKNKTGRPYGKLRADWYEQIDVTMKEFNRTCKRFQNYIV